jgi:5-formyltetrahydrofolate cyclo-ligase
MRDGLMQTREDIRAWRRATRAELLARRLRVPRNEKEHTRAAVREFIWEQFPELRHASIGFYWPFKGEIDLRHLVRDFLAVGAQAALPVVVERRQPLEFWAWRPRMKLERGMWNIPVPAAPNVVSPTALLVPLLGFDAAGYRLGYGGGYYDRTLATMRR